MIDQDGFRLNVGIILAHPTGSVLWAKRRGEDAWQFPQGGMKAGETSEETMYRELHEELGISSNQVFVLGKPQAGFGYQSPSSTPRQKTCVGQKQRWYLLALNDALFSRTDATDHPEFDAYQWVSYWYPLGQVIRLNGTCIVGQ